MAQDWRDFDNAVQATNNIGKSYKLPSVESLLLNLFESPLQFQH